jgi:acetyl-CoA acetyltransferase
VTSRNSAVIVDVIRTAGGKRHGALSGWHPADLGGTVLAELVRRSDLDPASVDDVILGCVTQVGDQAFNLGRNCVLAGGLPESVPATTIDRQCGSSQQALHFAAQGIMAGSYDIAIAAGADGRVPHAWLVRLWADDAPAVQAPRRAGTAGHLGRNDRGHVGSQP